MERKRKLTIAEMGRHGCMDCYDKECLEKEYPREENKEYKEGHYTKYGNYVAGRYVKNYAPHYCPFSECPYKDILDKYPSYGLYLTKCSTENEDLLDFVKRELKKFRERSGKYKYFDKRNKY